MDDPLVAAPRGTLWHAYAPVIVDGTSTTMLSITAMAPFQTKSLEELRFEDTFQLFHVPRTRRRPTQLERDVLAAIGDVALDTPQWWGALTDGASAPMLGEITTRTTRAVCGDAALHVVQWMTPTARRARQESVGVQHDELRLSRLVDYWPVECAAVDETRTTRAVERERLSYESLTASDRYILLAWVALRSLCLSDACPWPRDWGVASCCCWDLRPLVTSVTARMMELLDQYRELSTTTSADVNEAAIRAELLDHADPTSSPDLVSSLRVHFPMLLADMAATGRFAQQYLRAIAAAHALNGDARSVAPAPARGLFLLDGVDVSTLQLPSRPSAAATTTTTTLLIGCTVDDSGRVSDKTVEGHEDGVSLLDVSALVEALVPVYETALTEVNHVAFDSLLEREPRGSGEPTWLAVPDRPELTSTPRYTAATKNVSLRSKRLQLVATFVSGTDVSTGNQWASTTFMPHALADRIAAVAVVVVEQTNLAGLKLEVRPTFEDTAFRYGHGLDPENQYPDERLPREPTTVTLTSALDEQLSSSRANETRAVVLPGYADFRFTDARAVDPTKPCSYTALVVTLMNPWAHPPVDRSAVLNPPTQQEDEKASRYEFKTTVHEQSVEEARLVHYARHLEPRSRPSPNSVDARNQRTFPLPLYRLRSVAAVPSSQSPRTAAVWVYSTRNLVSGYTNPPRWWMTPRNVGAMEQEQTYRRQYIIQRLDDEMKQSGQRISQAIGASTKDTTSGARDAPPGDPAPLDRGDPTLEEAAACFVRLSLLRHLHQGFQNASSPDWIVSAAAVIDLIEAYQTAADVDAKIEVLRAFVGRDYPAESLVSTVDHACGIVHRLAERWGERLSEEIEPLRLAASLNPYHHPMVDAAVVDDLLSVSTRTQLLDELDALRSEIVGDVENVAQSPVLRLVDPSYFLSSSNVTPTLPLFSARCTGSVRERMDATLTTEAMQVPYVHLRHVRWIPSDVAIAMDGTAHYQSYISGLPLKCQSTTYEAIEVVTTALVPLFEDVLTQITTSPDSFSTITNTSSVAPCTWSLAGRAVQMLLEVTEITLQPGDVLDDAWHNCNRRNPVSKAHKSIPDNIVASGIYFARLDNIATPRVRFGHHDDPVTKPVGFVDGYDGRGFVHSNLFQRRFDPLRLADATQPGSLLLVVLHLVNPNTPMVSTAHMRPQQRETIVELTLGPVAQRFGLPRDIVELVASMIAWPEDVLSRREGRKLMDYGSLIRWHPTCFECLVSTST